MRWPFVSLLHHRELWWQFTLRSLHLQHRGSLLGATWVVLQPLLMMALYTWVFGTLFQGRYGVVGEAESVWDYGLGIFLSLTLFGLVADTLGQSPGLIVSQPNFVKKVVFPLEILPAAAVLAALLRLAVTLGLVLLGVATLGGGLPATAWWLPAVLVPLVGLAFGLAWGLAALGVFLRDIGQLTGLLATALLWASAVFYSTQRIPDAAAPFLLLNPVLHAVELARAFVLWGQTPAEAGGSLLVLWAGALAALLAGHLLFQGLRRSFADVL